MQLAEIKAVTMTSLEIAELTGKRHDNVIRDIKSMLDGLGLTHLSFEGSYKDSTGRALVCFNLPKRETLILVSGYNVELRAKIIDRWQELEDQAKPKLPSNYIEALQALLQSEQEKERLQLERDIAIETKAEIGSRREATAMATASNATQRANRLEVELDKSKQYATIKRMSLLYHGLKFNWRDLKDASNEMGLPPIDVYDANYGTVKGYHADVWLAIYSLEII